MDLVCRSRRAPFARPASPHITTGFAPNQIHALIRVPFELVGDFCEDNDQAVPGRHLVVQAILRDARAWPFDPPDTLGAT
jgi:hypothetical protein